METEAAFEGTAPTMVLVNSTRANCSRRILLLVAIGHRSPVIVADEVSEVASAVLASIDLAGDRASIGASLAGVDQGTGAGAGATLDLRADPDICNGNGFGRADGTGIGVGVVVRVPSCAVDGAVTAWPVIDRFNLEDIVGTIFPPTAGLAFVSHPNTGVTVNADVDLNAE